MVQSMTELSERHRDFARERDPNGTTAAIPMNHLRSLEAVAGDSLPDFASGERSANRDELLAQILHAESLRVRPATWAAREWEPDEC